MAKSYKCNNEEIIMASVRMTNELRELITHNYRKQCQAAFDKDFDVESTMRKIVEDR